MICHRKRKYNIYHFVVITLKYPFILGLGHFYKNTCQQISVEGFLHTCHVKQLMGMHKRTVWNSTVTPAWPDPTHSASTKEFASSEDSEALVFLQNFKSSIWINRHRTIQSIHIQPCSRAFLLNQQWVVHPDSFCRFQRTFYTISLWRNHKMQDLLM